MIKMRLDRLFVVMLLIAAPLFSQAQTHKRMKKKVSYAKGTWFGHWGYNRSAYTKSNIRFTGPGYNFVMEGAKAHDNPEKLSSVYVSINKLTIPQFNWRFGYYFKDHWAITVGQDHMKYLFADKNHVFLSGEIDPGVDQINGWEGVYNSEPIVTDRNTFHYECSDGLNYLRIELMRTDQWVKLGNNDMFALSTNIGVATGGILSFTDFRFGTVDYFKNPIENRKTVSLSGYGLTGHVSVRFEFLRHLYIQPGFGGGLVHQIKAKTRPNDPLSYARHAFGYVDFNTVAGFIFYLRSKNGCDSCPVW